MKYSILILSLFLMQSYWSQEVRETAQPAKSISVTKEADSGKALHAENKAVYVSSDTKQTENERTVEYYDGLIEAIKIKVEYMKADEAENKKATENGWFDKMNATITWAEEQKVKLQNSNK